MIEFALTISLTLLLIFGLIDFSRAIYTASIVQWAAQSGARAAMIEDVLQEEVEEAVKSKLALLDPDLVEIAAPVWSGNVVEVEVTYPFEFVAPVVGQLVGEEIEMSSIASMIAH
jgi:Flp pilus assembly protein TadG